MAKAAKDLINYAGLTAKGAGEVAGNLSYPTIRRIMAGDAAVGEPSLMALAGVLKLPINFFLLILDDDRAALEKLTMPIYVREYIATLLDSGPPPARSRRARA